MSIKKFYLLQLLYFVSLIQYGYSQTTTVEGFIKEKGSNEPIPFVHVFFKGTQIGTTSDTSGYFISTITTAGIKEDSLIISSLGYNTVKVFLKNNERQKITIEMTPQFYQLQEFEVKPGENLAWRVLRKIIENKEKNNPDYRVNYSSEEYSKIRFDLNHFTEKIKKNILLRPFDFIWKNVDTTSDGITYLPVLMVEKMITHYFQSTPKENKDYIDAINTTGLEGPKIMKFVEDLALTPNFYNNYVPILGKNFPSPLNGNYKNNYKFYLTDSTGVDSNRTYKIVFIPKQKRDLAFSGEMLIDANDAAIKEITLRFDIMANVNFVRSFWINQKYDKLKNKYWMLKESNVIGDFTVIENSSDLTGFFGRKNSKFSNYYIDSVLPKKIFKGSAIVIESDSAKNKSNYYWENSRSFELSKEDKGIFKMSDSLKNDPRFILRKKIILGITSGYYPLCSIDIGDIYSFYSYNTIEQSRLKLGFKTNENLKIPLSLSTYIAYGTYDEKWKYKVNPEFNFRKLKSKVGVFLRDDIDQLSRSFNNIELDHVLSSFIQVGSSNASRNYVKDYNIYIENKWTTGFTSRLNYFNNTITPVKDVLFESINSNGFLQNHSNYHSSGIDLTLKYSWQNKNVTGNFYNKKEFKNTFKKYPDIAIQWMVADKNFGSQFDFQKIKVSFKQQVRLQKAGYLKYYIEAGKTFNTVPYPYLDLPFSNQLVVLDEYAFNLMNFLEYASDEYISAHLEHHIEGLILDRIPLINKLKWRNFIFAKGYFGNLSQKNQQEIYLFPKNLNKLKDPYYEVGFGIENIFKIARVDFIWRLTDINKPGVYYFIIKPSFKFAF
jgi:hypothetical protein